MRFPSKSPKNAGWMALRFESEGLRVVHLRRQPQALPKVSVAAFYPAQAAAWEQTLGKLGRELNARQYTWSCLLRGGEYQVLSVDAPNVPADELKTAIRWRLKDMLDFHVDDATIDVLDVPVDKNAPAGRGHSMYAVAARNQLIRERQALFEACRIPLRAIDIPDMAQRNISALLEPEGRGVAMLSFDEDGGLFTVSFNKELYLSRRVDVSLAQLQQDGQQAASFERITLELQRSLDHFERQYHFITVTKLVLAPLGGAEDGLRAHLAENLYVAVDVLDLASVFDLSEASQLATAERQQQYFLTLGAALRHEEKAL